MLKWFSVASRAAMSSSAVLLELVPIPKDCFLLSEGTSCGIIGESNIKCLPDTCKKKYLSTSPEPTVHLQQLLAHGGVSSVLYQDFLQVRSVSLQKSTFF